MAAKEFLDDREHALENEYFYRKDREFIDHLRKEGERTRSAAPSKRNSRPMTRHFF